MGIRIETKPYCDTCPFFEPEVVRLYGNGEICDQYIRCEKWKKCDKIEEHIRETRIQNKPLDDYQK